MPTNTKRKQRAKNSSAVIDNGGNMKYGNPKAKIGTPLSTKTTVWQFKCC